jgi:hypothetical protein
MLLWVFGLLLSFAGLFIWLEFGCMIPRSGGEKVYLEAVYRRPKLLATVVFAVYSVCLGFTGTFFLFHPFYGTMILTEFKRLAVLFSHQT